MEKKEKRRRNTQAPMPLQSILVDMKQRGGHYAK
jgi:hypothetical protein